MGRVQGSLRDGAVMESSSQNCFAGFAGMSAPLRATWRPPALLLLPGLLLSGETGQRDCGEESEERGKLDLMQSRAA